MTAAMSGPLPVVELSDVTFRRESKEILHGITFAVHEGEHWALLGPNGAGKSTILDFCGAVTHPTSGEQSSIPVDQDLLSGCGWDV
ncbi:ATP-binding cassette domain-containing protein, partial [Streptosporangium lutulentum]|uniref:ATP-binding cassette domain-containing protein n=1 Tax=Streptosporangium lutulentum TaxID=1461250 RepID=UPI003631B489